jgi:hypothetical protein
MTPIEMIHVLKKHISSIVRSDQESRLGATCESARLPERAHIFCGKLPMNRSRKRFQFWIFRTPHYVAIPNNKFHLFHLSRHRLFDTIG